MIPAFAYFDSPGTDGDQSGEFAHRLLAPMGRWPLRTVVLLALVPMLTLRWTAPDLSLLAVTCALQMLPSLWLVGWGNAVRKRASAAATVGNSLSLRQLHGTALAMAAAAGLVGGALWWLGSDSLATALHRDLDLEHGKMLAFLRLEAGQFAFWPVLVTCMALAEGRLRDAERSSFRGAAVMIAAMSALSVVLFGWHPQAWPVATMAGHAFVALMALASLPQDALAGGRPQWSWREGAALIGQSQLVAAEEPGMLAPFFIVAVLAGTSQLPCATWQPAAAMTLLACLMACGWQLAGHLEPVATIADLHADEYRARWRFARSLDAALLVALGLSIVLGTYGDTIVSAWLGMRKGEGPTVVPLAFFATVSAPAAVCAQWLKRADKAGAVANARVVEFALAAAIGATLTAAFGWKGGAWALVAARLLSTGPLLLRRTCKHLGLEAEEVALSQLWRMGLVAAPSAFAAVAFSQFKPPRTPREWAIQLLIVAILYVVFAFAGWSLMDSRRDRD